LIPGHSCEVIDLNAYRQKKEEEAKAAEAAELEEDLQYLREMLASIPDEPTTGPFPSFSHDLWDMDSWLNHLTTSGSYEMSDFNGYPDISPVQDEET
jgi:hypothetical protein